MEFLALLQLSLLTQRRGPHPPYGCQGGAPGALGVNQLVRSSGEIVELPGICELPVQPGDLLILQTPGGGGFGAAE